MKGAAAAAIGTRRACGRAVVFFSAVLGIFLGSLGCSQTLADRVQAMIDAQNVGHVEMVLSFYEEDARVENDGLWVREGRAQLQELYELQHYLHSQMRMRAIRERRDRVICDIEEQNDLYTLLGIDAIYYRNVTVIFGERGIARLHMRRGAESRKAHERCVLAFMRWAGEWRRSELERLIVSGGPQVTAENVAVWLSLLREYRQTYPGGCQ